MLTQEVLMDIYKRLYTYFGPRGWWPAETSWEVVVGAILAQNVAWRNVEQAIQNLKEAKLLEFKKMQLASIEDLARLIVPTRYYNVKAKKLKFFVDYLSQEYAGSLEQLLDQPLNKLRPELLNLWGLGPETVDSILLYAGGHMTFVVDAYTRRIFHRLGFFTEEISYKDMRQIFMQNLPQEVQLYNEYHALIDALGSQICGNRSPRCMDCPLQELCRYPKNNVIAI